MRVSWRRIFFLFVILCGLLGGLKLGFATPSSFCFLEGRGIYYKSLKQNFTNFEPENRLKIALSTTFRSNKKQIPKSDAVKL